MDWNLCIFRQQKKYHDQEDLCQIHSCMQDEQSLNIAIAKQDDDIMMHWENAVDLIAVDANYHPLC